MKFGIVLVSYNRILDLKGALQRYEEQTLPPEFVIVVDNACTDGTADFLDLWEGQEGRFSRYVIHSPQNLGGSGGFSLGMQRALTLECDFIFLADDDAYADAHMLEALDAGYRKAGAGKEIAALCTAVKNQGEWGKTHRLRRRKEAYRIVFSLVQDEEYQKECFEVDGLSFVGAAIRKDVVQKIGLPKKEYFIYHDDTEYSIRIGKLGRILCVPGSIMYHDSPLDGRITWKEYYGVRNMIDMYKDHYPLHYALYLSLFFYLKKGVLARELTREQRKLYRIAVLDGLRGKLGLSAAYRPGTKV